MELVDRLEDPRIAAFRNVKDADLIARTTGVRGGHFMAEGELVVRRLLEGSRFRAAAVLVSERRVERLRDALERVDEATRVFVAPQGLMDEIVGFHLHQGCLALGVRRPVPGAEALVGEAGERARMIVFGEDLVNHDNMGGLFRNAAALGADAVLLTRRCCDPLYRKSIRVSMGAALRVPFGEAADVADGLRSLRSAGFTALALTPREDAVDVGEYVSGARATARRVALLVGAEGPGLSEAALAGADERVRIPMSAGADSLNVATAAAVAMHVFGMLVRGRGRG